ncbi:MAG: hypothetical protein K2W82_17500 [Candidatus Obscuribacterales bacterium]|nr:hypothetical protein [Candidatus Obscuribacterales bacterium]
MNQNQTFLSLLAIVAFSFAAVLVGKYLINFGEVLNFVVLVCSAACILYCVYGLQKVALNVDEAEAFPLLLILSMGIAVGFGYLFMSLAACGVFSLIALGVLFLGLNNS